MSTGNSHENEREQEAVRLTLYIRVQIQEGKTNEEIISDLVAKGMTPEQAKMHVELSRKFHDEFRKQQMERIQAMPDAEVDEGQIYKVMAEYGKRAAVAERGWKRMWTGLVVLILGSCITWFTYSSATSSPIGGSYTICYGAIILGALYFLWGLVEWLGNR